MSAIGSSPCRWSLITPLLEVATACSSTNLGEIDESVDSREVMPGPGIFDGDDGETTLKWSSGDSSAGGEMTVAEQQAEFDRFKLRNQLRSEGADSTEYQEFLQWLGYRKFKAAQ